MAAGNEGPPDLDELFTDLRKKVDNMFKTKSNNNNGSGLNGNKEPIDANPGGLSVGKIFLIVLLIWMATGFYIVDQGSRGVVLLSLIHI